MKAHIIGTEVNKWTGRKSFRQYSVYAIVDAREQSNLLDSPMYYYSMADKTFFPAVEDDWYGLAVKEGCGVAIDYVDNHGRERREIVNPENLLPYEKIFLMGL